MCFTDAHMVTHCSLFSFYFHKVVDMSYFISCPGVGEGEGGGGGGSNGVVVSCMIVTHEIAMAVSHV